MTDDKGYLDNETVMSFRRPAGTELIDRQKEFRTEVKQDPLDDRSGSLTLQELDYLHTDYPCTSIIRRRINTFTTTISTVISLHFYWMT